MKQKNNMAKIHPIYRLHKIRVHHNRWLAWTIAYLVFIAIALSGFISITNINSDTELIAEREFKSWVSYRNPALGFGLRYPSNWSIEADSSNIVIFGPTNSKDLSVMVVSTEASAESAIRHTLNIGKEQKIIIDGVPASKISNLIDKNHYEAVVLIKYNNKLYIIRGTTNYVETLLQTFDFLAQK